MGSPSPPKPDPAGDYSKSLKTYLKFLPKLLSGEQGARQTYDPQRIEEQMQLQDTYGARQSQQQLDALQRLDPQGVAIRQQLGNAVSGDLASGYNLPAGLKTQVTSQIRAAEAARGQTLGNAAISAESIYSGNAANQLYQQHLQNASGFLAGSTPEQQLTLVQPVTPDRTSQYVNPSAPGQLGQNNYQNMLAQYQLAQGNARGIGSTIGGIAGTAIGAYYGGPVGAQAGGAVGSAGGGAIGGYFSDARKKNHIEYIGRSPGGHPIYEFNYDDCHGRFRGTIAQELLATCPDACTLGTDGFWRVDYSKTDIKLEEIPELVEA